MRKKKTKKKKDGEEAVFQSGGASSRRAAKFKSLSRGGQQKKMQRNREIRDSALETSAHRVVRVGWVISSFGHFHVTLLIDFL